MKDSELENRCYKGLLDRSVQFSFEAAAHHTFTEKFCVAQKFEWIHLDF